MRGSGGRLRAALLAGLLAALPPSPAGTQERRPPPDTLSSTPDEALPAAAFRDAGAAELIARARAARGRDIEGMESYEGILRERIYVGLTAFRFRRERALFEQERIARLRWSADGERAIQWIGARRAVPIIGADTKLEPGEAAEGGRVARAGAEAEEELRAELPDELLGSADLPSFAFDPSGDRITFGDDDALHPLADSAVDHYRYASGDTLRVRLPDREIVLYEVRVEPLRADFHLVAGSLWFDSETASLVRATYRPARAFDLALDEPEDAEEVPGFLRPVQAEISYVTVEYSLQELRYWLPRRFALEGEARLGSLVSIPLTVEWSVRDYRVNEATTEIPIRGPLPRGWARSEERVEEEDGRVHYVTVIVPRRDSLLSSPELSEDFGTRAPTAFTDDEIDELREELETLLPTYRRFRPRVAWGLERGLVRYNRVEGLSFGTAATVPLTPLLTMDAEVRVGTGDREPNGAFTIRRGGESRWWRLQAYHRLESMADRGDPFSFTSSLSALFLGSDRGQFYRATGAAAGLRREGSRARWDLSLFHERQRPVGLGTDFYLLEPILDDPVDEVLAADDVTLTGLRGTLRWFRGIDPNGLILTGEILGEAAEGDASYRRLSTSISASHPLGDGLAGAVEVAAGAVWGDDVPRQREHFLGGSSTLRGFNTNEIRGEAYWRARAEVATGFAGARIGLFGDAGWAGDRDRIRWDDAVASLGIGTSLLDGLFRADLARAVKGESRWKVHLYLDGLF